MQTFTLPKKLSQTDDLIGLLLVTIIISLWGISLVLLLSVQLAHTSWFYLICAVLVRTFLHTGLFILAHDAIHTNLMPNNKRINDIIGYITVGLYAFLPYKQCCINHWKHHRHPSQLDDPDFHNGTHHPVSWYLKFIRAYLSVPAMILFTINWCLIFWVGSQIFQISLANLMLFAFLPLILSSIQLFFFGTYLPHGENCEKSNYSPRVKSNRYLVLKSLLTCYHFGYYHWEHHEYPQTPWYRLPTVHFNKQ